MMSPEVLPPRVALWRPHQSRRARPNMAPWALQRPTLSVGESGGDRLILRLALALPTVPPACPTSGASRRCRRDRPAPLVAAATRAIITHHQQQLEEGSVGVVAMMALLGRFGGAPRVGGNDGEVAAGLDVTSAPPNSTTRADFAIGSTCGSACASPKTDPPIPCF